MAKSTYQERFCKGLEAHGETLVKITGKYRVYTRTKYLLDTMKGTPIPGKFYYVGQSGALRIGKTASEAIPAHSSVKFRLLMIGEGRV